jgi:hypothetical protein
MKMLIDIERLEHDGLLPRASLDVLRAYAVRRSGVTAIHILLVFGAIAVAAGIMAQVPGAATGAALGVVFLLPGMLVLHSGREQWSRLGGIAVIIGALMLAPSVALLVDRPFTGSLAAALILGVAAIPARSRFLIALVPFALAAAIGGSTGYWHACYALCLREPLITILAFTLLAAAGWEYAARLREERCRDMAIVFARLCVILVNFGFWIGSLWGDTPGHSWIAPMSQDYIFMAHPAISPLAFTAGWAILLLALAAWGLRQHRRFMVNTAVVFAAIHGYTQWFEYFHLRPDAVILAGIAAIALGLGLWHYNRPA